MFINSPLLLLIMKDIFSRLIKKIKSDDDIREKVIIKSRPVIKDSKQAIYAIHKGSLKEAEDLIKSAQKGIDEIKKLNFSVGAYNAALQEYVEAVTYLHYVKTGELISDLDIKVDAENYLLGLCDLTGELSRRAVYAVIKENFSEVEKIHKFVFALHNEFLKFEFRNGELRKKSDSVKWNLKKIEEILYDLKLREKI